MEEYDSVYMVSGLSRVPETALSLETRSSDITSVLIEDTESLTRKLAFASTPCLSCPAPARCGIYVFICQKTLTCTPGLPYQPRRVISPLPPSCLAQPRRFFMQTVGEMDSSLGTRDHILNLSPQCVRGTYSYRCFVIKVTFCNL